MIYSISSIQITLGSNKMVNMKVSQKPTSNEQTRPTKKTKRDQFMERPKVSIKPTFREVEEACKEDNLKVIKEMVKNHGIDLLCISQFWGNYTLLGIAACSSKIAIMKYLMNQGGKIEGEELERVCRKANLKVIKEIVKKFGVDTIYYYEGLDQKLTLLEIATWSCQITVMKFLIDYGANIGATLCKAIGWGCDTSVLKLLIENGAKVHSGLLSEATSKRNSFSIVKLLLDSGLDLNAKYRNNETFLVFAKRIQRYDIVELVEKKLKEQSRPSKKTRGTQSKKSTKVPKKQIELDDCMVCFNPIKIHCAFNPCGHAKACETCCLKITKAAKPTCPLCKSDVVNHLKIFF